MKEVYRQRLHRRLSIRPNEPADRGWPFTIQENMTQSFDSRDPQPKASPTDTDTPLDPKDLADLANQQTQDEYRRAYLQQLRRRACPGCGDDGSIPG